MDVPIDPNLEETKGGSGHVGKCLLSYNKDKVGLLCNVPEDLKDKVDAKKWMEAVLKTADKRLTTKMMPGASAAQAKGEVYGDGEKGLYPIKIRDELILGSLK